MERILSKVVDYVAEHTSNFRKAQNGTFTCPICGELSCHSIFKTYRLNCLNCQTLMGDITDLVRRFEPDKKALSQDEIFFYLRNKYNIDVLTNKDVSNVLNLYYQNKFDLVPIVRNQKIPIEKDWLNKPHLDIVGWEEWLKDGLNIGIKTGKRSNITVIDIDTKEIPPSLVDCLPRTLTQETTKGYHYIYQYEPSIPTTRIDELKVDILNDGKQFVAYPSVVDNIRRRIQDFSTPIAKMSPELVKFIQQNTIPNLKSFSEKIKEEIASDAPLNIDLASIEEGTRTHFLMRMGGILRKQLNSSETAYTLSVINSNFCKPPLPDREFRNIAGSLDRYILFDDQELSHKVFTYLKIVEEATSRDVKEALGETKERIDKALAFLVKEGYCVKKSRMFIIVKHVEWKDTFQDDGAHVKFEVPYFNDVAYFRSGDMILVGGQQKIGKSHIALNIVKQLVDQGIKPYYINLESGNRFASIARALGLKEGDFWHATHFSPEQVELERDSVTILDWLLPKDYAETDKLFQYFAHQLVKNGGLLYVFAQLKENKEFFAQNMVAMFPALVSRYFYNVSGEGVDIPTEGYFQVDYIREPKLKGKHATVPCQYDWDTKRLNKVQLSVLPPKKEESTEEFREIQWEE